MAAGPSHLRAQFGFALRTQRLALEMSQAEVGRLVGRSQGWVQKVENAQIARITAKDLESLITALRVEDPIQAEAFRNLARSPYAEQGVHIGPTIAAGTVGASAFKYVAASARMISADNVEVHNSLIQSEGYTRRQFELNPHIDDLDGAVARRQSYRSTILDQASPPECTFLMGYGALRKDMGDGAMMAVQLRHLLEMSERPHMTLLVLPSNAAFPASTCDFTLFQFNNTGTNDFVSVEISGTGPLTFDTSALLTSYRIRWERKRSCALGARESRIEIAKVLREYTRK